ncbi:type 11 methyltransferase [Brachyspira suanatina]|uniref:Type 11 methyltransferase n=1 Tax=Brachyspira suanatina TaxID=381802 RepID=A0A0G4K6B0_9SPIR|nr:class I SAM-dependent methyltransferase [Brachyspira suanatina]CRF32902.1 type 11 methyltransferase [Brachyspira suanatina]
MPKNIIDKLAWFIPIRSLRNKFKINMKKHIINNYKYIKKTANSEIVNKYLTGLKGIEIGGAAYADYGIDAIKIDRVNISSNINNPYYLEQTKHNSFIQDIDIIADGDNLPFKDNTVDFVFTSHVLEHFFDPIKALEEWYRVTKKGGYIFMIIPHKERTFDKDRERTTLNELIGRHNGSIKSEKQFDDMHHSVWITEDILELCKYLNYNVVEYHDMDDCRKDGFIIVILK